MANELLRQQLLSFLAHTYETKGPGPASIREFCQQHSHSFEQVKLVVGMLYGQGVVNTVIGEEHAWLTPRGYEIAKPSDACVPKAGGTHVNFNAPVSGAAIAIDRGSASVTNIIVTNENILQHYANALSQTPGIPPEKKDGWVHTLSEISKHPVAVESFKALLQGLSM